MNLKVSNSDNLTTLNFKKPYKQIRFSKKTSIQAYEWNQYLDLFIKMTEEQKQ